MRQKERRRDGEEGEDGTGEESGNIGMGRKGKMEQESENIGMGRKGKMEQESENIGMGRKGKMEQERRVGAWSYPSKIN